MRYRKIRNRRNRGKKQKKIIIISTLILMFFFTVGYSAFQTIISINVRGNIVRDERCVVGNVFEFEQKDEIQEFKVPCSGTYKLETWGASGGSALDLEGGYGGYSAGNVNLKLKEKLYVVVGGEGESTLELEKKSENYYKIINGGYNGGGYGGSGQCGNLRYSSGGGGVTHIAETSGLLSSLSSKTEKLLIISAGGGGAYTFETKTYGAYGPGASAGGYIGNTAYFTLVSHTKTHYATGGTQSSGGLRGTSYEDNISTVGYFGHGGSAGGTTCANYSGGGAGLYGGGYGQFAPGAGGSSYIGNPSLTDKAMYCYDCEESLDLTKPEIFTVSTTGDSNYKDTLNCPDGYSEIPISKCAKNGNGFARITLISTK